ncbi:hypothetical protein C5765_10385 [Listeria monocytogenes]|nr:hypothetical protein [Listeria monocytogenes]EAG4746902.1 hypothetical protein [Listeria monocytogenes]
MKKTVHGWEIISNLDIRLYQDEAGGVVILLDKDGFGDQVPVLLNFDDEYFEERTQAMEYIEVERD